LPALLTAPRSRRRLYAYVLFHRSSSDGVDHRSDRRSRRAGGLGRGRAWTTILGLCVLGVIVSLPFALARPVDRVVQPLVGAVQTVAFVLAYRMLTARSTASSDIR
jgi:hypothetical protein